MLGKKILWLVVALGFLSNTGCCAFWDRVCHRDQHRYEPAQCCPPPSQCGCPPNYYQPAPGAAVPVPPSGPPRNTWQGNYCP